MPRVIKISGFMIGMRCIENRSKCVKIAVYALYSGHALSHGPVALYSYTARADTAAVYSRGIQFTAYTLYSPIRPSSGRKWSKKGHLLTTKLKTTMKVETWVYRHVHKPLRTGVPFRIRIVALWFASGTTALGKVMGQHRVHVHTRFKVGFYPASTMVALSALRRVRPYRWRPLSPTTAICSLPESLAEAASWQQAQALMKVTQHGGWVPSSSSSSQRGLATVTESGLGI